MLHLRETGGCRGVVGAQGRGRKEWLRIHQNWLFESVSFAFPFLVLPACFSGSICIYYDSSRSALLWLFCFALL